MQFLQVIRIAYVNGSPGEPSEAVSENLNYESMIFHQDNSAQFLEPMFSFLLK